MMFKTRCMLLFFIASRHADTTAAFTVPIRSRAARWIIWLTCLSACSSAVWLLHRLACSASSALFCVISCPYSPFIRTKSPSSRASSARTSNSFNSPPISEDSAASASRVALCASTCFTTSENSAIAWGKWAVDSSSSMPAMSHRSCTRSPASSMFSVMIVTSELLTEMMRLRSSRRETKVTESASALVCSNWMLNDVFSHSTILEVL
mmetsp:Transcript_53765/g.109608  ORF Transcript_53765/g.109608 Transcript_53765/m.109608 type:complete len:208 (-) Transcript_53765:387-1010(-)